MVENFAVVDNSDMLMSLSGLLQIMCGLQMF